MEIFNPLVIQTLFDATVCNLQCVVVKVATCCLIFNPPLKKRFQFFVAAHLIDLMNNFKNAKTKLNTALQLTKCDGFW